MQALTQNRSFNRVLIFAVIAFTLLAISWGIARSHESAPVADSYYANNASRLAASTDTQIQQLQDQLRAAPDDWQAYSQLGMAYLQKARETADPTYYQKAEGALTAALNLQPDDYTSISAMGALELARHQFHSALDWGERARHINPDRTYAYGVVADAQVELGQYREAVVTLQRMVDLRPDMSSYSRISYIRELHGDVPGALQMMQQAVDGGTPNLEATAWTRTQLGALYFNMGDPKGAEREYQHTLQDRPNYVYALAGLARVRAAQGQTAEAIKLLTQASNIIPLPDFVITLGDLYYKNNQPELAMQQYNLVAAIEKLYQANGVDLDMEMALFNADHDQNLQATVERARKAYAARPSIHGADVLSWALYKAGQYDEAKSYSEQALKLGTKDSLKLFHAGMLAYRLGENEQARTYLEQALAINPYFSILYADQARETLRELQ